MKHIFKKLHIGSSSSSHEPNRSNDTLTSVSPSCASDNRTAPGQNSGPTSVLAPALRGNYLREASACKQSTEMLEKTIDDCKGN